MAANKPDKKPERETVQCPVCDGRGGQSFGTDTIACYRCKGKGTVRKGA